MNPDGVTVLIPFIVYMTFMSIADSQLLVASSAITEDLYRLFFRKRTSETELAWVGRLAVVATAVVAFFYRTKSKIHRSEPRCLCLGRIWCYLWSVDRTIPLLEEND